MADKVINLRPSVIRYSQDTICHKFHFENELMRIKDVMEDVCGGRLSITQIGRMSVVKVGSNWVTVNNRTLWIFRELEERGICEEISVKVDYSIPDNKMTTADDGVSVKVSHLSLLQAAETCVEILFDDRCGSPLQLVRDEGKTRIWKAQTECGCYDDSSTFIDRSVRGFHEVQTPYLCRGEGSMRCLAVDSIKQRWRKERKEETEG